MKREYLENFAKEQIGKEVAFDDFSYELQKMGFEDINDCSELEEILESGVCYYAFVDKIGIDEENEELDGCKLRLEFDVREWNGEDEDITSSLIKIVDCTIE